MSRVTLVLALALLAFAAAAPLDKLARQARFRAERMSPAKLNADMRAQPEQWTTPQFADDQASQEEKDEAATSGAGTPPTAPAEPDPNGNSAVDDKTKGAANGSSDKFAETEDEVTDDTTDAAHADSAKFVQVRTAEQDDGSDDPTEAPIAGTAFVELLNGPLNPADDPEPDTGSTGSGDDASEQPAFQDNTPETDDGSGSDGSGDEQQGNEKPAAFADDSGSDSGDNGDNGNVDDNRNAVEANVGDQTTGAFIERGANDDSNVAFVTPEPADEPRLADDGTTEGEPEVQGAGQGEGDGSSNNNWVTPTLVDSVSFVQFDLPSYTPKLAPIGPPRFVHGPEMTGQKFIADETGIPADARNDIPGTVHHYENAEARVDEDVPERLGTDDNPVAAQVVPVFLEDAPAGAPAPAASQASAPSSSGSTDAPPSADKALGEAVPPPTNDKDKFAADQKTDVNDAAKEGGKENAP